MGGENLRRKKGWLPQTFQSWSPPWLRQSGEDLHETHGQASSSSGLPRAAQVETLSSRAPIPQIALNLKPPQRRQPPPPMKPPDGRSGLLQVPAVPAAPWGGQDETISPIHPPSPMRHSPPLPSGRVPSLPPGSSLDPVLTRGN